MKKTQLLKKHHPNSKATAAQRLQRRAIFQHIFREKQDYAQQDSKDTESRWLIRLVQQQSSKRKQHFCQAKSSILKMKYPKGKSQENDSP